jgi:CopG family nickel-responsive transcriptional regulator
MSLERDLLRLFDNFVEGEGFPTRSEAIKDAIRKRLVGKKWKGGGDVAAAVAIVYDQRKTRLLQRLTAIRQRFNRIIIVAQNIHLDTTNCLESLIVQGKADEIRQLSRQLRSVKGLKHSEIIVIASGLAV